ncbi:hypothetical protein RRG08_018457 [Elysia crispata]|uniref:Uncharacterized protein n=1 Tax=Elysia crispata TaxID=231223 RepID=A0AAE1D518_9GAST|nr:hypothetical protein RRG08_018457 [Elysia crispata]
MIVRDVRESEWGSVFIGGRGGGRMARLFSGQIFLLWLPSDAQLSPVTSRSFEMCSSNTPINLLGRQDKQVEGSWQVSNLPETTRGCLASMRRLGRTK